MLTTPRHREDQDTVRELHWAHSLIRRQLLEVQCLGDEPAECGPSSTDAVTLSWRLGSACLQLHRLLERHLGGRTRSWPGEPRSDEGRPRPDVLERIERERRRVHSRLRSVGALVSIAGEGPAELRRVHAALDDLRRHLDALPELEQDEAVPTRSGAREHRR